MRRSGWHRSALTYCSNVHPGETPAGVEATLRERVASVRRARGLARMAAGLWLSQSAAATFAGDPAARQRFLGLLADNGIDPMTLNGFPYGGFHAPSVKQRVYSPHWADGRRFDYTRDLAKILAACLAPDAAEGTISTLPLGFAPDWTPDLHQEAAAALCRLAGELARLHERGGRSIRVCLEMEPGCVLESTAQAAAFFRDDLPGAAKRLKVAPEHLERHLGICYDVCHQAVMFEEPRESLDLLRANGITVGKIQLSCALEIADPRRGEAREALEDYAEPRYLHQVRTRQPGGRLGGTPDLPEALDAKGLPDTQPWRIHFHAPVQAEHLSRGEIRTTRPELIKVLDYLAARPDLRPHLEVETYTWQVLPAELRPQTDAQLITVLAAELEWVERQLETRGLLESSP